MQDRFDPATEQPLSDQAMARKDAVLLELAKVESPPKPPEALRFVGDGDFRAVGEELLGRIVAHTDFAPNHTILDIGSGVGRLAVPASSYLTPDGRYIGLEPVKQAVQWCREAICADHPNFQFEHLPVYHPNYNHQDKGDAGKTAWPVADSSVDRIASLSVFTHLTLDVISHYARECYRCLRPGGIVFSTFFLIDEWSLSAAADAPHGLNFEALPSLNAWVIDANSPLAAIGFKPEVIAEIFEAAGLNDFGGVVRGRWSGVASLQGPSPYQDVWCWQKPQ